MEKLPKKLESKLTERERNNALRKLSLPGSFVDFSSNDYLGLAQNEDAREIANVLADKYHGKNGATGSRLLTGNHSLYKDLEDYLAKHHRVESALIFNSGYNANVGFFSSVPQRDDVVLYDELIHASIRDGLQMGNAKHYKFSHNNLENLKEKILSLKAKSESEMDIYVVTESVFSMDGDTPDLIAMAKLCQEHNCHLVVDEAHATGLFGKGRDLVCALGLEDQVFARIITFGKAMGCHGAAILGSNRLKEFLINFARSLIYTTALPPHAVASIWASYQVMEKMGETLGRLLTEKITFFKQEAQRLQLSNQFIASNAAIHCAVVPGNENVKAIANKLKEEGFDVKPILSPTVKVNEERLRFCLHSYNSKEEISRVLLLLKNLLVT